MSSSQADWRVGIIGAGTIVQKGHIPNFQMYPGAEVVAICDINEARAREVADEAGIEHAFQDYNTMLEQIRPNVVVVATPNIFHKPMAIAALEAGAHVLCEKPLALSYADGVEMFDIAEREGRVLTVGTHYRWSAPMQAARQQVDAGFFGDIYALRTIWRRRSGIPGYGSWFTNKDLAGGGALLDIGIHALDRGLYLMGYPQPVSVSGSTFSKLGPQGVGLGGWGIDRRPPQADARFDVDDLTWGFIRFDNGATLILEVSWALHFEDQFYTEILGTRGGGRVSSEAAMELFTILNGQDSDILTRVPPDPVGSYRRQTVDFLRHLEGDSNAMLIDRRQSLIAVQIIEAIFRSAESGREVRLE